MTNNFTPAKAGQQSKRLSKEEYAEKMKAEKEAVYQMADDTAKAIVSDPEKFKALPCSKPWFIRTVPIASNTISSLMRRPPRISLPM